MALFKWLKGKGKKDFEVKNPFEDIDNDEDERRRDEGAETRRTDEEETIIHDGTQIVYFACDTPKQNVIDILHSLNKDVQVSSSFSTISNILINNYRVILLKLNVSNISQTHRQQIKSF